MPSFKNVFFFFLVTFCVTGSNFGNLFKKSRLLSSRVLELINDLRFPYHSAVLWFDERSRRPVHLRLEAVKQGDQRPSNRVIRGCQTVGLEAVKQGAQRPSNMVIRGCQTVGLKAIIQGEQRPSNREISGRQIG